MGVARRQLVESRAKSRRRPSGLPEWVPPDMRHHDRGLSALPQPHARDDRRIFRDLRCRTARRPTAPSHAAGAFEHADADADALVASIRSFMAEDVAACERMQQGTASPSFGVGALATTHEEPIRRFHASLRRRSHRERRAGSGRPSCPTSRAPGGETGAALDGGPWDEVSDVLWLQVGLHFCDLRTALPACPIGTRARSCRRPSAGRVEVARRRDHVPPRPRLLAPDPCPSRREHRAPDRPRRCTSAGQASRSAGSSPRGPTTRVPWPSGHRSRWRRPGPHRADREPWRWPSGVALHPAAHASRTDDGWTPERATFPVDPALGVDEAARALVDDGPLPGGWATVATAAQHELGRCPSRGPVDARLGGPAQVGVGPRRAARRAPARARTRRAAPVRRRLAPPRHRLQPGADPRSRAAAALPRRPALPPRAARARGAARRGAGRSRHRAWRRSTPSG